MVVDAVVTGAAVDAVTVDSSVDGGGVVVGVLVVVVVVVAVVLGTVDVSVDDGPASPPPLQAATRVVPPTNHTGSRRLAPMGAS